MPVDPSLLAVAAAAVLLAVAGGALRDVRSALTGTALVVAAGVSVPMGAALLALGGALPVRSRRHRRLAGWGVALVLPAAAAVTVAAVASPAALPVPPPDGPVAMALLGLGMMGVTAGGVRAHRVWRRSRRHRDLLTAVGHAVLAAAVAGGPLVAWDPRGGGWSALVAGLGVLLVMAGPAADIRAVLATPVDGDPTVAVAERDLGVQLRGLLATAAGHDPRAGTHSRRVAGLAVRVAERMGLSARLQQQAAAAALLHHVGAVRGRSGDAVAGDVLLAALAAPPPHAVRGAVREQGEELAALEERYQALEGSVPIVTRILAVCDAFDTRTGEAGVPPAAAITELRDGAGSRYCPAAVEALSAVLEGGLHEVQDPPPAPAWRGRRPRISR